MCIRDSSSRRAARRRRERPRELREGPRELPEGPGPRELPDGPDRRPRELPDGPAQAGSSHSIADTKIRSRCLGNRSGVSKSSCHR
eukprot:6652132-Pyramimonas_sp.AAC.1